MVTLVIDPLLGRGANCVGTWNFFGLIVDILRLIFKLFYRFDIFFTALVSRILINASSAQ